MTTWFCLECFAEVGERDARCHACDAETSRTDRTYDDMLIRALDHRLSDRRILAAEILGRRRSRAATDTLERLALVSEDPYLQAATARALATIEPDHPLVRQLGESGPVLVRVALGRDR